MAWNEPGNSNNKDPWGNKGGKDQGPPDLDEIYNDTMKKIRKAFGGKGGDGSPSGKSGGGFSSSGLILVAVILAAVWAYLGFATIKEAERGVVLRFGQFHGVIEPGLQWQPAFIDDVIPVNVESISSLTSSGKMLTKDENVVLVEMEVQYRIENPRNFLFSVTDPIYSLRQATDSALRYVVGHSSMDAVLTTGREEVRQATWQQLEDTITKYNLGLQVVDVNFLAVRPPEQVKPAFDDAIAAQEDENRYIQEAQAYAKAREPQARGVVRRMEEEAKAYRSRVVLEARGEVARFEKLLPEYEAAPKVTRQRLYLDAMEDVYSKTTKVLLDTEGSGNMIYLPLDKIMEKQKQSQDETADDNQTPASGQYSPPVTQLPNSSRGSGIRESSRFSGGR
ncbi:FtsH protease activity modulator HflK [Catenovulum sp. 2E275]|uniref:FtsH protease activity modulator HflK n=1 Tax=Catenovulum sp. 2E275 TaxID=2980497 RepID=UPI0021D09C15|nr:FtsH protease activity modulator HflK [Catenovulum sp. 2E275]MCU4676336.1 FtsH protease activity modulator HflK [Catenovulum sp. 2E275]